LGPDPGRAMEVFRSSDFELATFCKLWAKDFLSYRMLGFTIGQFDGFCIAKLGHRIRPNVESEYGSSSPPPCPRFNIMARHIHNGKKKVTLCKLKFIGVNSPKYRKSEHGSYAITICNSQCFLLFVCNLEPPTPTVRSKRERTIGRFVIYSPHNRFFYGYPLAYDFFTNFTGRQKYDTSLTRGRLESHVIKEKPTYQLLTLPRAHITHTHTHTSHTSQR